MEGPGLGPGQQHPPCSNQTHFCFCFCTTLPLFTLLPPLTPPVSSSSSPFTVCHSSPHPVRLHPPALSSCLSSAPLCPTALPTRGFSLPTWCAPAVPTCHCLFVSPSSPRVRPASLYLSAPRQSLLIPGKSASRFGRRGSALGIGAVEEVVIPSGGRGSGTACTCTRCSLLALRTEAILGTLPPPSQDRPKGVQGRVPQLW